MKLYILIREDIKTSIGKLMAHIGHISTEVGMMYSKYNYVYEWHDYYDQTKIILSVKNDSDMWYYIKIAKKTIYPDLVISLKDAGFTKEIEKGTVLMCGILCKDDEAKQIGLKELKLFKR